MLRHFDPEIAQLVATARQVVSQTHMLTAEMNSLMDHLEEFAALRDQLREEYGNEGLT